MIPLAPMLNELQILSEKTDALIATVNQLRSENTRLRNQVAQLAADQKSMQERLKNAAEKVEVLLNQLPQDS